MMGKQKEDGREGKAYSHVGEDCAVRGYWPRIDPMSRV